MFFLIFLGIYTLVLLSTKKKICNKNGWKHTLCFSTLYFFLNYNSAYSFMQTEGKKVLLQCCNGSRWPSWFNTSVCYLSVSNSVLRSLVAKYIMTWDGCLLRFTELLHSEQWLDTCIHTYTHTRKTQQWQQRCFGLVKKLKKSQSWVSVTEWLWTYTHSNL